MLSDIADRFNQSLSLKVFSDSEILLEDLITVLNEHDLNFPHSHLLLLLDEFSAENKNRYAKMISINKLSIALKEHGLGKQIYLEEYSNEEFDSDKENIQEEYYDKFDESSLPIANKIEDHSINVEEEALEGNYNEPFENSISIEEAIHESMDHETELEFIQYGISIEK